MVVQKLQQLNLGGAQVDDGRLQLGLILHAQQLDAVEVNLRNVAGLEAVTADVDDLVVVVKVVLRQLHHGLGLERLDKSSAQSEFERALQVLVLRCGDLRAFLCALQPQLALVVALVQVAEAGRDERALQRLPNAVVGRDLCAVHGSGELRIGPQIGRDLLGPHLVHVVGVGLQRRVGGFKPRLDLVPGIAGLCECAWNSGCHEKSAENRSGQIPFRSTRSRNHSAPSFFRWPEQNSSLEWIFLGRCCAQNGFPCHQWIVELLLERK